MHALWMHPEKTKSDFARRYADLIATAASRRLITNAVTAGHHGRVWRVTPAGLSHVWDEFH